jgi:hypothetical protein
MSRTGQECFSFLTVAITSVGFMILVVIEAIFVVEQENTGKLIVYEKG